MKTTIEIPDELAREAREMARDASTTLRDLVVTGLRSEVERRRQPPRTDFVFTTFDGGPGSGLVEGVDPADVIEMSYEA